MKTLVYAKRQSFIRAIIIVNVIVFLMWHLLSNPTAESDFMVNNFLVSWTGLIQGRLLILLTSAFSHTMFLHILMNMYVLKGFGPIVEAALGAKRFLRFYLVAGILSSVSHALVSAFILKQPELPALGASGAISGVILLFSLFFPKQKILIFGLIPMPAAWGALVFVGLDLWGLVAQAEGGGLPIGHGAHLGGALTGMIYYTFFLRRQRQLPI